jgi:hypothetical protein
VPDVPDDKTEKVKMRASMRTSNIVVVCAFVVCVHVHTYMHTCTYIYVCVCKEEKDTEIPL